MQYRSELAGYITTYLFFLDVIWLGDIINNDKDAIVSTKEHTMGQVEFHLTCTIPYTKATRTIDVLFFNTDSWSSKVTRVSMFLPFDEMGFQFPLHMKKCEINI